MKIRDKERQNNKQMKGERGYVEREWIAEAPFFSFLLFHYFICCDGVLEHIRVAS